MESIIVDQCKPKYPCLKKVKEGCANAGMVVLFTGKYSGSVVYIPSNCVHGLGKHSTTWTVEDFEMLGDETIKLRNT